MSRIAMAPEIQDDFERILQHPLRFRATDRPSRIEDIMKAIDALEGNPLIGRPAGADLRELVIGRQARGYLALYRYVAAIDTLFVLAIRGQKEAGYARASFAPRNPVPADRRTETAKT